MSTGGSRVSIPNNIRKTIQDIKEITGKHSDDDIYTMLKECNMDPNETTQRLLYLDTFHEVKKKRDRRKVNEKNGVSQESSWATGTQRRGVRGGRGSYSSSYNSHGAGVGRNVSARKENGVSNRMERGLKPSLTVPEKTENNANPRVTNSSNISFNGSMSISFGGSSHELDPQSSAVSGFYSSASDPVVVPPLNCRIPGVDAINGEVNNGNRSSTANDVANNIQVAFEDVIPTKTVLKESQIIEKNQSSEPSQSSSLTSFGSLEFVSIQDGQSSQQLIGPSKVVASEAATLAVEAGSLLLPQLNVSVLEEATSELDMKLEKLNIFAHQPVIFPDHFQVPEDFKNGLTFGSLDATFEQSIKCVNGPDDRKGSMPAIELLQGNDKAARETSMSNISVSSNDREGDYPNNLHSLPSVPDNSSHLEDNVSSVAAPKYNQSKQEIRLHQGGPQYPFIQSAPNYGFSFIQPMLGSQLVQSEGPEPQSGNSLVSSTSGSMATATQTGGIGQSSIAVSPPPFPVFRQPYPPNYFPLGPYFPPLYLASNAPQFLGHSGFPQQPSTGNVYLSPAAVPPGVRFSVPQGKPGITAGNPTQFGFPSGYGSYSPSLAVTSGSSAGNEDLVASALKENSVYTTVQQGEGPLVWLPASGRDISSLHANSFNNHLLQGQHVAFSPPQAGHGPFTGIYHPPQTMATTSTVPPRLRHSQSIVGSIETIGPPMGPYQQPQHAVSWNSNY